MTTAAEEAPARPFVDVPLPTLGPQVCRWIERNIVLGEGDYLGQPIRLRPYQRSFLYRLYELVPVDPAERWTDPRTWATRRLPMRRRYRRALWGLPKGNGKTPIAASVGAVELAGPAIFAGWGDNGRPRVTNRVSPSIPIVASSFEQADLVFGDLRTAFEESSTLRHIAETFEKEVILRSGHGSAYRVAAVAGANDGGRPSCLLVDELHELTGNKERVHVVLGNGVAKRRDGMELNITTAGSDLESLCGKLYTYGRQVEAGLIEDDEFLFEWWEAGPEHDISDREALRADPEPLRAAIRACNPAADDFVNVEAKVARYFQIPLFEFERYHLNRWTRAGESWLPPGAWGRCRTTTGQRWTLEDGAPDLAAFDQEAPAYAAVDFAYKHDNVAVLLAQKRDDPTSPAGWRLRVHVRTWRPADSGGRVDVGAVEEYLRHLHRELTLEWVPYDPAYFQRSAEVLEDEGLPMLEFPQSRQRMVPACQHAYGLIVDHLIEHDGDPILEDHVLSAESRDGEGGWTLSKGKSARKIDGCIALVIGSWEATAPADEGLTGSLMGTNPKEDDRGRTGSPPR